MDCHPMNLTSWARLFWKPTFVLGITQKKKHSSVFSENNVAVFSLSNLPDFFWLRLRPEISRTQNCHLKVTFSSTCWRSLSHPKKVTRNCQGVTFSKAHHFGYPTGFCCIRWWQIALHLLHCCRIRKCLREKKRLFVFFWTRDWDVRKFRVFFVFFKDDLTVSNISLFEVSMLNFRVSDIFCQQQGDSSQIWSKRWFMEFGWVRSFQQSGHGLYGFCTSN